MCTPELPLVRYLQENSTKGLSDTDHERMPVISAGSVLNVHPMVSAASAKANTEIQGFFTGAFIE